MKYTKEQVKDATARLKETLQPGDVVYCNLRRVSRSGMSRTIQLLVFRCYNGDERNPSPLWLGYNAAKVCGMPYDQNKEGVKIGGCGMDMGFALVYDLSSALFGDGYALTHRWLS